MSDTLIKEFVIVGGGTAGWMTAAALSSMLTPEHTKITLVESESIGTIGVGEATIPDIINFNRMLGIPEDEFMKATKATFKLGIEFKNWGQVGESYFHPFGKFGADMQGIDFHQYWMHSHRNGNANEISSYSLCRKAADQNKFSLPSNDPRNVQSQMRYAYHFDATSYARFLRNYAETRGVVRVEGIVDKIKTSKNNGYITQLELQSGEVLSGDFFFDCTGFKALLLEKTLGVDYVDWTHWLPCDSAQAVASKQVGPLKPYTVATAKDAGWQWRIPTQHRTGNGHIYARDFMSDEQARESLLRDIDGDVMGDPKQLRFRTGCREKFWDKNCIAIGLSAGFLEPLESTSIYLIQMGISRFISMFPTADLPDIVSEEYNRHIRLLFDQVRDFIILHYCATQRNDTPFWEYCRTMTLPDSLIHKMELFRSAGRVYRYEDELFAKTSWVAVFLGQNILPQSVDPIVSTLPAEQVMRSLNSMEAAMKNAVMQMPSHQSFIDNYCLSPS